MHNLTDSLLLFSSLGKKSILLQIAEIFRSLQHNQAAQDELPHQIENAFGRLCNKEENLSRRRKEKLSLLRRSLYHEIKRLLELATAYGFTENLWQSYLTFLLFTNENSFSLSQERCPLQEGSINGLALCDCAIFRKLFAFDFSEIEAALSTDCFSVIINYTAIEKPARMYNRNVSRQVQRVRPLLAAAASDKEFLQVLRSFYRDYGVGRLGLNRAFRIKLQKSALAFYPISNMENVQLSDLIGYERQKAELRANTEAFLAGLPANNVLLYGDSGTGKSTCVKAIVNEYYEQGLRMIEISKHQFQYLADVIAAVKSRNYCFIIFMDDLSFEEYEVEYKFLKAVIEGGAETKPENILIYATSNRRHLVKEDWSDRDDIEHIGEIHRSDTMEEKLSLVERFGVTIHYPSPGHQEFYEIVLALAARRPELRQSKEEILAAASIWELRHGGPSGRTAEQFINAFASKAALAAKTRQ